MEELLGKIRKLNWILQERGEDVFSFDELCEILSSLMDANVYIMGRKGKVLGSHYTIRTDSATILDSETGEEVLPAEYRKNLMEIEETMVNVQKEDALKIFTNEWNTYDKLTMLIPVYGGGQKLGVLIFARYDVPFETSDVILGEYGATVMGVEIERRQNREIENDARKRAVVQMAIGTLSYTEIEAVQQILSELQGDEGLVVASKIADRSKITRSVIVNALRKLESAGVIESRSLGMKGTHIRIINSKLKNELERLEM